MQTINALPSDVFWANLTRPSVRVRFTDRGTDFVREFADFISATRFAKRHRYQGGRAIVEMRKP